MVGVRHGRAPWEAEPSAVIEWAGLGYHRGLVPAQRFVHSQQRPLRLVEMQGAAKPFKMGKAKTKKSKLQLHREAEAKKKAEAEAEAARVLQESMEYFATEETGSKEFVKGGTAKDGQYTASSSGERYRPAAEKAEPVTKKKDVNIFEQEAVKEAAKPKVPSKRKKEPSARELFLQELKQDQAAREARDAARKSGNPMPMADGSRRSGFDVEYDAYGGTKGSFADPNDSLTTNLYIGNLHPTANEDLIARTFTVHGAIASVKIMWPRTDEERARERNSGFVQFMERRSAERAKNALDGTTLLGRQITISWGKPCAKPARALYPATMATADGGFSAVAGFGITDSGAMVSIKTGGSQYPIPPGSANLRIVIKPPSDVAVMTAADRVAEFVKADGWALEQLILEREMSNPMFAFLHETQSPDHAYYRWRAYSLAQGDTLEKFRTEPFRMYENGPIWQPPDCPIMAPEGIESGSRVFSEHTAEQAGAAAVASSVATVAKTEDARQSSAGERRIRERARERDSDGRARILDGQLSNRQLDDLHEMLRGLQVERKSIEEGMMFCLDHSEAADEVIDALVESLTLSAAESHVEKKMARLYLLSDILHNASAPYPKTARFRSQIESKLPEILGSFREAIQSMGRISAEHMRYVCSYPGHSPALHNRTDSTTAALIGNG